MENIAGMNCDTSTGICEIPQQFTNNKAAATKPVKLLYFTDPICSSCWGIEPQLRKLNQEYGEYFDVEYRMGGLLKSWDEYGGSDVSGPETVAAHWEEAGAYYNMPIDGDVWMEDPLHSSYPASIGFKAAQLQGNKKAALFLRRIKEMVFVEKKNISRMEHLLQAAHDIELDTILFEQDYENRAKQLFEEDLMLKQQWGVRGFPTIFFIDEDDNRFKVYGSKAYPLYEQALLKLLPGEAVKAVAASYETIFESQPTATLQEFALFYDKSYAEAEKILTDLEQQNKLSRFNSKAGPIWKTIE